ncbi:MAG TPA: hypothetical protein VMF67_06655 [Rhizomicrobium sp.]|nr:hypothetical protein [Rhizomicrobium sp.]
MAVLSASESDSGAAPAGDDKPHARYQNDNARNHRYVDIMLLRCIDLQGPRPKHRLRIRIFKMPKQQCDDANRNEQNPDESNGPHGIYFSQYTKAKRAGIPIPARSSNSHQAPLMML